MPKKFLHLCLAALYLTPYTIQTLKLMVPHTSASQPSTVDAAPRSTTSAVASPADDDAGPRPALASTMASRPTPVSPSALSPLVLRSEVTRLARSVRYLWQLQFQFCALHARIEYSWGARVFFKFMAMGTWSAQRLSKRWGFKKCTCACSGVWLPRIVGGTRGSSARCLEVTFNELHCPLAID